MSSNRNSKLLRIMEQLEDRVLFDAVPDGGFLFQPENADNNLAPAQEMSIDTTQQAEDVQQPRELILVDANVEGADLIIADILQQRGDRQLEIQLLDANRDGIDQITELLDGSDTRYDAVHIISHGNAGQLNLGSSVLDADSLSGYAGQLVGWADGMTEDADLLFYGCNLAGDADGEAFINTLSELTGADVAASDDLTGAAELGGDWELERSTGSIEALTLSSSSFANVLLETDNGFVIGEQANFNALDEIDVVPQGQTGTSSRLYTNAATANNGAITIDVRITLLNTFDANGNITTGTANQMPVTFSDFADGPLLLARSEANGNEPGFEGHSIDVLVEYFDQDTGAALSVVGDFTVKDIDFELPTANGSGIEGFTVTDDQIETYQLSTNPVSQIDVVNNIDGTTTFQNTTGNGGGADQERWVRFTSYSLDSIVLNFQARNANTGYGLSTTPFSVTPITFGEAELDLDGDDSTDSNEAYLGSFSTGVPTGIVDSDVTISSMDAAATVSAISITPSGIEDAANETFTFNGDGGTSLDITLDGTITDSLLTVGGVVYNIDFDGTEFQIETDSGASVTIAEAESFLRAIQFEYDSGTAATQDRSFDIYVTDDLGNRSNSAISRLVRGVSATWTITGSTNVVEGGTASYTISAPTNLAAGQSASVTLTLVDESSTFLDYENFLDAVDAAIGTRTDIVRVGDVLTHTSATGGVMPPLTINLAAIDDAEAEGVETYRVVLSNPVNSLLVDKEVVTEIAASDNAPVAADDDLATTENATLSGNVITADNGNGIDSDLDGDTLSVIAVNGQAAGVVANIAGTGGGTFNIAANGGYTFDPGSDFDSLAAGETATTTVQYTISDGNGGTDTATVTVTVTGTNDTPTSVGTIPLQVGVDATVASPLDISGFFADTDTTDTLSFSAASTLPPGLTIDSSSGVISGTYDNSASLTSPHSVVITATDSQGATTTQAFTWTVTNPGPVATDDAVSVTEGNTTSSNVVTADLGSGLDSDVDGDALSVIGVSGSAANVGTPTAGSNGGIFDIASNGGFTFDTDTDFDHLAAGETTTTSIDYTISDGEGGTDTATLTVTVTGTNDAPTAIGTIPTQSGVDATVSSPLNVSGFFGDVDVTDTLTFNAGATLPAGLSIDPGTGIITGTYDANASQSGPYSVVITATDSQGATTTQGFTWNVSNPAPTATDDGFAATQGSTLSGNVVTTDNGSGVDSDPDGDVLSVAAVNGQAANVGTVVAGSTGGTFTINGDGSYSFNTGSDFDFLAAGETASTTVDYTVSDGEGGTDTATVTVTVTGTNDTPTSVGTCLLYTSPSPRDQRGSRMPSSA